MKTLGITTKALVLAAGLAIAGCGGSDGGGAAEPVVPTTDDQPHDGVDEHADHHEGEQHEEHQLPPAMTAFHDIMAPLWHANEGEQRVADTCAKLPDMVDGVEAISDEGAPEGTPAVDAWLAAVSDLSSQLETLQQVCEGGPPSTAEGSYPAEGSLAEFQAEFTGVHDAFHAVMAAMGMEH